MGRGKEYIKRMLFFIKFSFPETSQKYQVKKRKILENKMNSLHIYLSFPIYVLLDLEMFSASIEITYSVQVVRLVLFAERRNFPFSTNNATKKVELPINL